MKNMYKIYYREKGIRYVDKLIAPPDIIFDSLPKSSLFHYVPTEYTDHEEHHSPEIDPNYPAFQGYSRKSCVEYVDKYVETLGAVRKPSYNLNELTRPWRRANIKQWMHGIGLWKTDHNPETLIVLNYGYLDTVHKYMPSQLASYHRWHNRQKTIWAKVSEIAKASERHQFIVFPIPSVLQGRTILEKYAKEAITPRLSVIFGQAGWPGYMQLDLWRWLKAETRKDSLISLVDPSHYPKINLVFESSNGRQAIVNLGYLNSWIKGHENTTEYSSIVQHPETTIQLLFLKLSMALNAIVTDEEQLETTEQFITTVPAAGVKTEPDAIDPDTVRETKDSEDTGLIDDTVDTTEYDEAGSEDTNDYHAGFKQKLVGKPSYQSVDKLESQEHEVSLSKESNKSLMIGVEQDIEALDRLNLMQLKNSGIKLTAVDDAVEIKPVIDLEKLKQKVYQYQTPVDLLKAKLNENAESNLVTAADYRKHIEAIEAYRKSPDPYGSKKPRLEAMVIEPGETKITPEDTAIVVSDSVQDKTMAKSSLNSYHRKYLKQVYKKDILNAIDSVQAAGVVIKRHEIDVTHSVLGTYEHHSLEIKPIDGAASVLQFTFPKVEEDGTMVAVGNRYMQRVQRVDLPIRKIGPRIVALSTYYGKTFVQINPKVVNSSLSWLYRKINEASLSQGNFIHDVNPGDVFDNDFEAPYLFGALGQEYEQLTAGTNTLHFNRKTIEQLIEPSILKTIEKNQRRCCGLSKDNSPIVVDMENTFYAVTKQGEKPLGDIYTLLSLDPEKCPVDIAEVRIFSKYVPVGLLLGYYLGFSNLLALLEVKYRTVEPRKQKNLEKDEFAISFKDITYVFKTTDRISAMIFAGFGDYEKTIKLYDQAAFENKDVYLNILAAKKFSAIYIREMDMMENCFVDPISKEILETMKEPQTFIGLVIRACELLLTYTHPSSQDRSVMRDRGYERFAGTLYREVMRSVRDFRNKNLVGRSKVNMSPYEVWNNIMSDNSLKIVEEINPIQNLKETEVVVYSGQGGREKDSMTKPTRAFHKNDVGVMSESSVDNSGVGMIAYLSADPNIDNLRGLMAKDKMLNPTTMFSTAALVSPAAAHDN